MKRLFRLDVLFAGLVDLVKLVPNEKHITKTNSGHEIHKEQPQLVIGAIRDVVESVRSGKR